MNPEGGKVARAAAVCPLIEAGNVYLPHPDYAPWVGDFIEECAAFPNGAHDDQVDAHDPGTPAMEHGRGRAGNLLDRPGSNQPGLGHVRIDYQGTRH